MEPADDDGEAVYLRAIMLSALIRLTSSGEDEVAIRACELLAVVCPELIPDKSDGADIVH